MKKLKRKLKFFINDIKKELDAIELWIDQYRCPHEYRGISAGLKPAEMCKFCDKINMLSEEQFFAKFGADKFAQLKRGY